MGTKIEYLHGNVTQVEGKQNCVTSVFLDCLVVVAQL